ncbi:hypothetical protein O3M35_009033 [Rhynocoris fuscipes]|uniref:Uncharacterized protein n=1 Tax=Rhynocoris fuscipes TaxID=488301 RepID=A0AAW1D930_9HEMI
MPRLFADRFRWIETITPAPPTFFHRAFLSKFLLKVPDAFGVDIALFFRDHLGLTLIV